MPPVPVVDLPLPCAFALGDKRSMPRRMNRSRVEHIRRNDEPGMETSLNCPGYLRFNSRTSRRSSAKVGRSQLRIFLFRALDSHKTIGERAVGASPHHPQMAFAIMAEVSI